MTPQPSISSTAEVSSSCSYCGLPVDACVEDDSQSIYCCYGCRFAHQIVKEGGEGGAIRWTVFRLGLSVFFTMNLMAFTMTMWSLDVYDVARDPLQVPLFEVFRWLSMLFALPVLLLLGLPMFQSALTQDQVRSRSVDLLIALAVLAAYAVSAVNVIRQTGTIYFEVGAMVLVMMTLGRWIEATGKQKATETLDSLATLLPDFVCRVNAHFHSPTNQTQDVIAASEIQTGDFLRVRAGERFPVDGLIESGHTTVDEQVFTGESIPISRVAGEAVLAGTVNLDADVVTRSTCRFQEGSVSRLMEVLRQARLSKGRYQQLADRTAAVFFPVVISAATLTFAFHLPRDASFALQAALAVLLIACPCALGLATPLAVWNAMNTGLSRQVLFRSGEAMEKLADCDVVCLDKTGTLTTGVPRVSQTAIFVETNSPYLAIAHQLAEASSHPFSRAIHASTRSQSDESSFRLLANTRTIPGGGVEASLGDGTIARLGSLEFTCCRSWLDIDCNDEAANRGANSSAQLQSGLCASCHAPVALATRVKLDRLRMAADALGASMVLLTIDARPVAGFLIAEEIRPEVAAIQQLHEIGIQLHVLSGDRKAQAAVLQGQLANSVVSMEFGLNPEDKRNRVEAFRRDGLTVIMVGDGINDAPALAASDVGIAMGCGADVSRGSADICLLGDDLASIPWAVQLARRTKSVVRQNLAWAFGYNSLGVVLAAMGYLNPAVAAGLMIASSLLVISNSLRLLEPGGARSSVESEPNGLADADSAVASLNPETSVLERSGQQVAVCEVTP